MVFFQKLICAGIEPGVNKIRLTGGEPLLRPGLCELVQELKSLDGLETIAMTTNGIILKRHLSSLVNAGLTHVNISLDTLHEMKYALIAGRPGDNVLNMARATCRAHQSHSQALERP